MALEWRRPVSRSARHMQEGLQLLTEAAKAAQLLGDERQEERLLGQLGRASMALRNWPEASDYLGRAFVIAAEVGDLQGKASHLGNLGQIQLELKNPQEAASHFQDALRIAESIPDPQMVGRLQASLGLAKLRSQMETGYSWDRMREAIELFQTALKIARETGDRRGEASHFGCLGNAYELMGSMNVSLPPFVGGSPYPMEEENRRTRYREDLERANQESYLEAFEYYSAAFSMASQIGDVAARESFQADLWRTGRLAGLDMMSGGGVNWNTWMRNHPDKPVPGFRYRK